MRAMAIKVNVSQKDQDSLNKILLDSGYAPQKRKFHCTVGFIEKDIPEEEVNTFGNNIINELQDFITPLSPTYEVEKAVHIFRHVIAFEPTQDSFIQLKHINGWLHEKVKELSEGRWELNKETLPGNYIPHLTLWRSHKTDHRFTKLQEIASTHPTFHLVDVGYVVF